MRVPAIARGEERRRRPGDQEKGEETRRRERRGEKEEERGELTLTVCVCRQMAKVHSPARPKRAAAAAARLGHRCGSAGKACGLGRAAAFGRVGAVGPSGAATRRRGLCRSAAAPSHLSRRLNEDGERASADL